MAILDEWFASILQLSEGDTLILNALDKPEQTRIARGLNELKASYMRVDPSLASKILVLKDAKGGKFFVKVRMMNQNLMGALIKDANGVAKTVSLEGDPNRNRKLLLMLQDGLSLSEIEDVLGELTDMERLKFFS